MRHSSATWMREAGADLIQNSRRAIEIGAIPSAVLPGRL